MRDLLSQPITPDEVIDYLKETVELETIMDSSGVAGSATPAAKTALAVVKMAIAVIKNDLGSTAAQSLESAFNSQNSPVKPMEEVS